MAPRTLLEYGESRDGYWTGAKFMKQMENAVKVAEAKYPKEKGFRLYWIFDQSQCHMACADDALKCQSHERKRRWSAAIHDTVLEGKAISMTKLIRKPNGDRVRIATPWYDRCFEATGSLPSQDESR